MQSKAKTVEAYLRELPEDRRKTITAVRAMILKNLPAGLVEVMSYGMIGYIVPPEKSPKTYNGQPLSFLGLASQKQHCSLYLMCIYASKGREDKLRKIFERASKKLNMGKCCIRFKKADDLPLDELGKFIAKSDPKEFLKLYESSHTKEARAKRTKARARK